MTTVSAPAALTTASSKAVHGPQSSAGPSARQVRAYEKALAQAGEGERLAVIHSELDEIGRQLLAAYQLPRRERRAHRRAWKDRQRAVEADLQVALLEHMANRKLRTI